LCSFKDAQQGTFDVGYKAKFETTGTDVAVTFELLDQKMVLLLIYGESSLQNIRWQIKG
jgi:hypothetical protein